VTGVEYALKALGLTKSGLARELRVTKGAVQQWRHIPANQNNHCLTLNREHGLKLHKLNPDVYPPELFGGVE